MLSRDDKMSPPPSSVRFFFSLRRHADDRISGQELLRIPLRSTQGEAQRCLRCYLES